MMHNWIRVLYSDNGSLTDYSIESQLNTETFLAPLVASEDYIYVGQYYPFNNLFIDLSVANDTASVLSVEYWDGRLWKTAVDVLDGTKSQGKTLKRSGIIQWSPDIDFSWSEITDTSRNQSALELQSVELYNLWWVRLKVSSTIDATTAIKTIGYRFTDTGMMSGIDPEINEYLQPWGGASKTNWDEQIQLASLYLVADLKASGLIVHPGNVLRFDDVSLATANRTLAMIYAQLGEAFKPKMKDALDVYNSLKNIKRFTFDSDRNGRVDRQEISNTVGQMIR